MTIIKMLDGTFAVRTGEITADGREIVALCHLDGSTLRTIYSKGTVVLTPIRIKLGPISLAAVNALKPTEAYEPEVR